MSSYKKMSKYIETLLALAEEGALNSAVLISSEGLAKKLGISQQSSSRRLRLLEEMGLISRKVTSKGQWIKITEEGADTLRSIYNMLKSAFEYRKDKLIISGEVCSGMGEGSYYVSLEQYRRQFSEKLGFEPYPGTLNLKLLTPEDVKARKMLSELAGIEIHGFVHNGRSFGSVKCFPAEVSGKKCAVVIPVRTHHTITTLELIAPEKLRSTLRLRDGDVVNVRVFV